MSQVDIAGADFWRDNATALFAQHQFDKALEAISESLRLNPRQGDALRIRGDVLRRLWRLDAAIADYRAAVACNGRDVDALHNLGGVLQMQKRFEEAASVYRAELAVLEKSDRRRQGNAVAELIRCLRQTCALDEAQDLVTSPGVKAALRGGLVEPFLAHAITDDPALLQACSRGFWPKTAAPAAPRVAVRDGRVRVAYLSYDFREHAISQLCVELFERHDRAAFEFFAISTGPDDGSAMRRRVAGAFEHFIDAQAMSDADIVKLIRDAEIDILVTIDGHTIGMRAGVLWQRPAPITAHYLGFPGTLGTPTIDYYIADSICIPSNAGRFFDEAIVRLPGSYQPSDSQRPRPTEGLAREDLGLDRDAFVLCAFHGALKLSKDAVETYLEILRRAAGSVLWMLADDVVRRNLVAFAEAKGIDPSRLVFASVAGREEYFRRLATADLFLDAWPYGAHTTAGEALWVGLPVLTILGRSMPSRVGASLLTAVGLPELIAADREGFIDIAVELAADRERVRALRSRLQSNSGASLFDSRQTAANLERAYAVMVERARRGERPSPLQLD